LSQAGRAIAAAAVSADQDGWELEGHGIRLHPLMAWWAVLYTLSMLARYQPAEWAAHINIDASRHATTVETLLKRALVIVPALIAEAIDQVAAPA
jgi:hypothetical protein